ncbi:MAG: hypothetical protein ACXWQO_00065 [Bdellovibrionota bacterium]
MLKFPLAILASILALNTAQAEDAAINARFAYRAPGQQSVVIQGDAGNVGLAGLCGPRDEKCKCVFMASEGGRKTIVTPVTSASLENGTATCSLPSSASPKVYSLVVIKSKNHGNTAPVEVKSKLGLKDVLGRLNANKVNHIFKYSCERTFFEGEGVNQECSGSSSSCISCPTQVSQRLGIISTKYDYYLFDNKAGDGNKGQKFAASYWPSICARPDAEFARANCSASIPDLRYGLYAEAGGLFNAKILMTRAPEQAPGSADLSADYGYAATPDRRGRCAPGFELAHAWTAEPKSIAAKSLNGKNPPSNFLNEGGALNNTVIETSKPASLLVSRQENETPCALATGSCANASFKAPQTVQTVQYTKLPAAVCVISKALLAEEAKSAQGESSETSAPGASSAE